MAFGEVVHLFDENGPLLWEFPGAHPLKSTPPPTKIRALHGLIDKALGRVPLDSYHLWRLR